RREAALLPTGQGPVDRQHSRGKNTARERIDALLDDESFVEFDQLRTHRTTAFGMEARHPEGDGVVAGYGTIDGRNVAVFAQDFTVFAASLPKLNGENMVKAHDFAATNGCPLTAINDGGGARSQDGVRSLAMFADIFRNNVMSSGVVPENSMI